MYSSSSDLFRRRILSGILRTCSCKKLVVAKVLGDFYLFFMVFDCQNNYTVHDVQTRTHIHKHIRTFL